MWGNQTLSLFWESLRLYLVFWWVWNTSHFPQVIVSKVQLVTMTQINRQHQKCLLVPIFLQNALLDRGEYLWFSNLLMEKWIVLLTCGMWPVLKPQLLLNVLLVVKIFPFQNFQQLASISVKIWECQNTAAAIFAVGLVKSSHRFPKQVWLY